MRKLAILLAFTVLAMPLFAQNTPRGERAQEAPNLDLVEQKFQSEFPKANRVSWETKGNRYLAVFTMNGYQMQALYTSAGLWIHTDIVVPIEKVPRNALNHCKSKFPDFNIIKSGFHDSMNKGSYYIILIRKNSTTKKVKYDDKGNYLGLE